MCFNKEMTGGFTVFSVLTGLWVLSGQGFWKSYSRRERIRVGLVFFYFAVMEGLQFVQYFVLGQCNSRMNVLTTQLGYYHICWQPLFSNIAFSGLSNKHQATWNFVILFSAVSGGLMALRMLIPSVFPGLFDLAPSFVSICDEEANGICGPETCAFPGVFHIQWSFRLVKASYVLPCVWLHFMNMFIIPCLLDMAIPAIVLFLSGPGISSLFDPVSGGERAAIWCFFSIAETALTVCSHYFVVRFAAKRKVESEAKIT
jgi:hypothetical protein